MGWADGWPHLRMGGATHRDPWDKQGGAFFRGENGRTMHTNPLSRGEPIAWGAIKAHCTAMDSVAANRRLNNRERKFNTNFFFSNFSGTSGISRQNPGISRQKSLVSLVSRDIPNFSAPTPSRGTPPPHPEKSRQKSLGLGSTNWKNSRGGSIHI